MSIGINLNLAIKIAKSKIGKCLTKVNLPKSQKYKWQCKNKHEWEASLSNIEGNKSKKGTWCPYCAGVRNQKSWIVRANEVSNKNKGSCLSNACQNGKEKLKFKCKDGHIWTTRVDHVIRGVWCPTCASTERHTVEKFTMLANERSGECLSKSYTNQHSFLKFKCSKGHIWKASAGNVLRGSWCPQCSGNVKLKVSDLQKIAKSRGGNCLTKKYKTAQDKYKWKCVNGHSWTATYGSIYSGSWCPVCSEGLGEKITRLYFETIFEMKFKKVHPAWLRDKKGDPWELDGFGNKKVGKYHIAFEHHGVQHYQFTPRFHKNIDEFKIQESKDKKRRQKCIENNVILFEIPQLMKLTKIEDLSKVIEKQFIKFNIKNINFDFYQKVEYSEIYKIGKHDELKQLVKIKKGKLIQSSIKKNKLYLLVECNNGHQWDVVPSSLKIGTWCPYCAGKKVSNGWYKHYQEIAKSKGGCCLSKESEYVDARTNLRWRCSESHEWHATPSSIKGRTWCPICGIKKRSDSQRDDIKKMQSLAISKNGKCLSREYINTISKLVWQCDKKHTWEAIPTSIKRGSWCPHCYKLNKKKKT